MNAGEQHHRAKHSNDLVERARQLHDRGWGYRRIGRELGVSWNTARDWCAYRTRAYG